MAKHRAMLAALAVGSMIGVGAAEAAGVNPPVVALAFDPPVATFATTPNSTVTITLTNPNPSTTLTGISISDGLPTQVTIPTGSLTTGTCNGTIVAGNRLLSDDGATLAGGASCTLTAPVTASAVGSYSSMTSVVSANESGPGDNASATLNMMAPPQIAAQFSPSTINTGGANTTTLTVTVTNPNTGAAVDQVVFQNTLPGGLAFASPSNLQVNGCGAAIVSTSPQFKLDDAVIEPGSACTVSIDVVADTAGVYGYEAGQVTSDLNAGGNGNTADPAPLTVVAPPIIGVTFGPSEIPLGGTSTITIRVLQGDEVPLTEFPGIAFSNTLPSGLVIAAVPNVFSSCNGTVTATAGSDTISLSGGQLSSNNSCQVNVAVTGNTAGSYTDTTGAPSSTAGGTGIPGSNFAPLIVVAPPSISAAFSPSTVTVGAGGSSGSTLTFTLGNPNLSTGLTGLAFSQTLPSGLTVSSVPAIVNHCNGTPSAVAGGSAIGLTGGSLASGGSCTIAVAVAASSVQTFNLTSSAVASTEGGTGGTASASLIANRAAPIVGGVSPAGGPLGGGNSVVITGSNLTGATAVKFGATSAASFTVDNATQITATAPAGVAGSVDVTVTGPGGTSAAVPTDLYTYGTSVVTLSASVNPSHFGDPVTLTAAVGSISGVPTGSVGFWDGSTLLATGALANHLTSVTISTLTVGSHSLVARYAGDGEFSAGASSPLTLTVDTTSIPTTEQGVYAYRTTLGNNHLAAPSAVALDRAHGHVLVADSGNHRVQIYDAVSLAVIGTIGVPGIAGSDNAHLDQPGGVGFDPASDRIFVADTLNQRVQIFDGASFAYLSTLPVTLDLPASVFVNTASNQLYIADSGDHRVLVLDAGSFASVATLGVAGTAGADNAHLNQPMDAELDPSTNQILVADSANRRVQIFDASSFAYVSTLGDATTDPADNLAFSRPVGAAFDPVSNLVLVADAGAENRVQVFDAMTYRYVLTLGTTGSAGASSSQFAAPGGLAVDPDHARLYVADQANDRVQSFSIAPVSSFAATLPGSRSVRLGTPATIFASFDNNSTATLGDCRVALPVTAPPGLTLDYQTTNPSTNALTGTPDTPATIPGKSLQTFLVTLQAADPLTAAGQALDFDCEGAAPASVILGVDTVDLTIAAGPVPDIIALAATPSDDGILVVPSGGAAAFAVASSNAGAGAQIIASVDTGTATLPLGVTLCQSNPSSGQCLATPAATVTFTDAAGASPTFSVFAQATGTIPLDPATSRLFVRFKDASGVLRGSTSVAVQTR